MTDKITPAHSQAEAHKYICKYPEHGTRESDPHYKSFDAYKRKMQGTPAWKCHIGDHLNDYSQCVLDKPLEIHHAFVEYALTNGVDPVALSKDFPHVHPDATPDEIDAFVESDENFMILCQFHHRGHGGAHNASFSDFTAELYVHGYIT